MKEKKKTSDGSTIKWLITISILTFFLSLVFSFVSSFAISKLNIVFAILLLFLVILLGVVFDIVAVAVMCAEEDHFHAKASKKLKGAKTSIILIRNSNKVSNFCADVIGDICGVLSGAISAIIALKLTSYYGITVDIQYYISALVASLTVGGKAIGKTIAKNNSAFIIDGVSKLLKIFEKKEKKAI